MRLTVGVLVIFLFRSSLALGTSAPRDTQSLFFGESRVTGLDDSRAVTTAIMKPFVLRNHTESSAHTLVRSTHPENTNCARDEQLCGNSCIPGNYICCPQNVSGGCPAEEDCREDKGKWGCCPKEDTCHWDDDGQGFFDALEDFGESFMWGNRRDNDVDALRPALGAAILAAIIAAVLP